ncbi:MAG: hypothetical protein OEV71_15410, partial [Nitrospira sp.]|nr:hypothetical protein [Nitrospira sp.]
PPNRIQSDSATAFSRIMPAVGGRIGIERIVELGSVLGRDAIFVLGSRMQQNPENIVAAMNALHRALTESF